MKQFKSSATMQNTLGSAEAASDEAIVNVVNKASR
jgi:hypothetical protein